MGVYEHATANGICPITGICDLWFGKKGHTSKFLNKP
jgi:hypothetical protein